MSWALQESSQSFPINS